MPAGERLERRQGVARPQKHLVAAIRAKCVQAAFMEPAMQRASIISFFVDERSDLLRADTRPIKLEWHANEDLTVGRGATIQTFVSQQLSRSKPRPMLLPGSKVVRDLMVGISLT
jgi:hypothetical protein